MGRRNQPGPDPYAEPGSGRKFYREPGEPQDERPTLRIRPFWASAEEAAAYLDAVRNHPLAVDLDADTVESNMAYIVRIAGIVARGPLERAAKPMPRRWGGPARPMQGPQEPSYEARLEEIFKPREPGEEG